MYRMSRAFIHQLGITGSSVRLEVEREIEYMYASDTVSKAYSDGDYAPCDIVMTINRHDTVMTVRPMY